jgi:hypothetical protein
MKQTNPGSVKIYETKLSSNNTGAQLDILPQIRLISIFESIYTPTMTCQIVLEDSINLRKNFPIIGEETFKISFKTPGVEDIATFVFDTYKNTNVKDVPNSKISAYTLDCISTESLQAVKKGQVSNAYYEPIHKIVEDIMVRFLGTKKKVMIEKTRGIDRINIPSVYLFAAIDYLKGRAVSAEVKNSSFVFFENQHGFNFRTIESLLYTKRNDYGGKVFTYDNTPTMYGDKSKPAMYRNIIVLEKFNLASIVKNITEGYRNAVNAFDIITKEFERTEFEFTKKANEFIASDEMPTLRNTNQFFADLKNQFDAKGKQIFMPKDSTKTSEFLPTSIGSKMAYKAMFGDSITLNALVFGDSTLTVGETVKINTKNVSGMTGRTTEEKAIAGMYLIVGLRHMISPGAEPLHHTAMQLVKMGDS